MAEFQTSEVDRKRASLIFRLPSVKFGDHGNQFSVEAILVKQWAP
jgi:hypothetical protein